MAKLSSINKNERRKKLAKKYAGQYARLKAIANDESKDDTERLIARLKMAEIPRNGNPTRVRNRCELTGRSRGFYRKFRLSRVMLRVSPMPPPGHHPETVLQAVAAERYRRELGKLQREQELRERVLPPTRHA